MKLPELEEQQIRFYRLINLILAVVIIATPIWALVKLFG